MAQPDEEVQEVQEEGKRPYAAASNVLAVLQRAQTRNLPETIDDDFFRLVEIPDVVFGRVRSALRFLDMISANGRPTDKFHSLASATDEEYREHLAAAIREAYRDDFTRIDPAQDTQAQIVSAFRRYQPRSQTSRMVMLFLGLCREAGIPVLDAPRERSMRRSLPANTRSRARPVPSKRDAGRTSPRQSNLAFPQELAGLLNGLPDVTTGWTKDRRDKFLEAFQVVLDFVIPIREIHEMEDSDGDLGGQI
jgi:hypothetical protein